MSFSYKNYVIII